MNSLVEYQPKFKTCTKCKAEKPVECFYRIHKSSSKRVSRCIDCRYEYITGYRLKNKNNTEWKNKRDIYCSKYRSDKKNKINELSKKKSKRDVEALADEYIKKYIRQALRIERSEITAEMIQEKRIQILKRRERLKTKQPLYA